MNLFKAFVQYLNFLKGFLSCYILNWVVFLFISEEKEDSISWTFNGFWLTWIESSLLEAVYSEYVEIHNSNIFFQQNKIIIMGQKSKRQSFGVLLCSVKRQDSYIRSRANDGCDGFNQSSVEKSTTENDGLWQQLKLSTTEKKMIFHFWMMQKGVWETCMTRSLDTIIHQGEQWRKGAQN